METTWAEGEERSIEETAEREKQVPIICGINKLQKEEELVNEGKKRGKENKKKENAFYVNRINKKALFCVSYYYQQWRGNTLTVKFIFILFSFAPVIPTFCTRTILFSFIPL